MKKSTLLLFALFSMFWQINAQVTIGAGNLQSENAPFEPFFGFSYTQTVYLASEINAAGDISDVQWYYSGTSALPNSQDIVIYMAELPRTEFASTTDWEPIASFTQVYAGGMTVTAGAEGWVTLTLDTPFTYAGTGNLVIAVEENGAGWDSGSDDFFNSQVTTNRTISYFSDGTNPDPIAPPTASNIDDTIPNVILGGITQACPNPGDLAVTGITANEAVLSWTENGTSTIWNVEIVPSGTAPSGTPTATNVSNPYTAMGLTAITEYDFYIQSDCGTEQSAFAGPFSFSTLCDVFIPDYIENFTTIIPDCWDEADSGDPTTGPGDLGGGSWGPDGFLNDGFTGAYKINLFTNNKSDWILSPLFDLTGGPFQVEFDFAVTNWNSSTVAGTLGSDDLVQLLITNDGGASWTPLLTYDSTSVFTISGLHPIVNLTAYSGQTVQFGILGSEGTVNDAEDIDVFVDNFQVRNVPTCPEPADLAVTNITPDGAELSWTEAGTSTIWNVEIVPSGSTPTGTPTATNVSNPYSVTGLDAITAYDFYVQSDCGGDLSSFTGPITFSTLCDIFIPDYLEDFTTIIPDCWDEADSGDATTGPGDLGAGSWGPDEFLNTGANDGAYKINLWVATKSDWIISPLFDLTGGPFQVEFDFGIMQFGSSTTAGTLGSDDIVQLLMTNDNGATWITLLTYDNTSVVPATGAHPVVDLTAYSGQIVQFGILGSEGTVNDPEDNDVFVDNFQVRNIPSCPEPSDLTATNLSLTSTEVGWTEAGTSTSWNIEYGVAGFAQGTGTIEAAVTTNPFVLNGLTSDTSYEFYVQAICGPGDESSWTGPFQFFTGYCESIPTSNDGDGVSNVTIGITDFPSIGDVTYENQTTPVVNVFQGINTNVEIDFAHGFTYNTNIWIDFNDDLVFDAAELVYQGNSSGGNPHTLDASFVMPITATIGEHRMRIGTADFGQATPNPCYNGTWGVTLDFTVNIQELLCTLAEADYTTVPDCDNDQFFIDVNITSLGDATSLEISNNFDTGTLQATTLDVYQAGPFPFGTAVKIFVTNEQDNNCVISSQTYEVLACPPSNDDCDAATEAVVNNGPTCEEVTPGTILAATPSGVDAGTCSGTPNDDVWFSFTALSEVQIISIINIVGGTTNLDHALYEGTCGSLVELACSNDTASVTPSLTIGNTYYIRIFSAGGVLETSTFNLCIREAPTNIICDNAENFCSVGGALTTPNIVGIPDPNDIACLGSAPNPTWNIIQIGESGPIEIEINQQDDAGNGLDVDFVIWGPFTSVEDACINIAYEDCPTCPFSNNPDNGFYPFGNIIDCSYSASSVENLSIDNAISGEVYMLLVTNFNGSAGNITIEQTNAGGIDNGTIDAEISAEIVSNEVVFVDTDSNPSTPVEANVCGFDSVTIETNSPFADEYVWYQNGFVMEEEISSTLVVTESDNYQVQAFDNQCGSEAFSQIVIVNLYNDAGSVDPQNITICDGPVADGAEDFDLNALSTSLGLGDGFTVSYYTNTSDANQAINAVASTYNSSGETLIIRIEDTDAATNGFLGCRQISEVVLAINPRPIVNQPADFIVCDDIDGNVDGVTEFDLTSIDDDVNTEADVVMTYHTSLADAEAGTDAFINPYSSQGETIYVRAENTTTGCYNTTSFNLVVNVVPLATFDTQFEYEVCPQATVPVTIGIVPTNFTAADVTVSWFLDGNPIPGNALTLDTVLVQGDYSAEIAFNASGCANTVTTFVMELPACIFPEGISPGVTPGFNDNFDLSSFGVTKLEIFNRNGTLVYSKNNYTNEWEGQTNDGKELPVGTYFYTMEYEGGKKKRSAWIYINR